MIWWTGLLRAVSIKKIADLFAYILLTHRVWGLNYQDFIIASTVHCICLNSLKHKHIFILQIFNHLFFFFCINRLCFCSSGLCPSCLSSYLSPSLLFTMCGHDWYFCLSSIWTFESFQKDSHARVTGIVTVQWTILYSLSLYSSKWEN